MKTYRIAVLVGSLRKESYNLKMAKALIALAPASLALQIVEIGELPLYNEDLETAPPEEWKVFREQIKNFEGILFVTPEYNRSVPAVLKNAIDVGSRPYSESVWDRKPGGIVSVSPGNMGGFGANHHLRQSLVFINIAAMPQPEAYVGGAAKLFDETGKLINDSTKEFMKKFMERFATWVDTNSKSHS
jgi:chromate reductase, NAD(P)H dehydrogenase (quinone)